MEKFEIHITGSPEIIPLLKSWDIKTLHAELRNPKNYTIGVEYMSSFVKEFENYEACKNYTDDLVDKLLSEKIEIYRVKIECPYFYKHYREMSVYLECHFSFINLEDIPYCPFVFNVNSLKYVATERVYLKSEYDFFIERCLDENKNAEIEYCLFDDNIRHDDKWIRSFFYIYN